MRIVLYPIFCSCQSVRDRAAQLEDERIRAAHAELVHRQEADKAGGSKLDDQGLMQIRGPAQDGEKQDLDSYGTREASLKEQLALLEGSKASTDDVLHVAYGTELETEELSYEDEDSSYDTSRLPGKMPIADPQVSAQETITVLRATQVTSEEGFGPQSDLSPFGMPEPESVNQFEIIKVAFYIICICVGSGSIIVRTRADHRKITPSELLTTVRLVANEVRSGIATRLKVGRLTGQRWDSVRAIDGI